MIINGSVKQEYIQIIKDCAPLLEESEFWMVKINDRDFHFWMVARTNNYQGKFYEISVSFLNLYKGGTSGLRRRERISTVCPQKWWITASGRGGKRGGQSHGMRPNHDNQIQLMTKAIAGVRRGWKNAFLKCKNFQCGIGTIWPIKL